MAREESRLVYSTDGEHVVSRKPRGGEGDDTRARSSKKQQPASRRTPPPNDGVVRVQRERSGRRGKTVTVVTGLPGSDSELDAVLKRLKQHCGAGGIRDGAVIEIQGDHRAAVQAALEALGHRVKLAGG